MADPLLQGALIIDDKCHPWIKGYGHTRLDRHHHWKRITSGVERRVWFTFGVFKWGLGHGPVRKTTL